MKGKDMSLKTRMIEKLNQALAPELLDVVDDSHRHAGHLGNPGSAAGSETHFSVKVVSSAFAGKTRLARHRMVNDALAEELATGLHALAIDARAPGE
jgi:BolA protein